MAVLADEIEERHGREICDRIFREALPPWEPMKRRDAPILERLRNEWRNSSLPKKRVLPGFKFSTGFLPTFWRKRDMADREKYRQCGSIDEFLDLKRRERDILLTRLRDEGKLWYTVVINDQVLEFIKSDPEMEVGRREEDKIYITKVPYNAIRYLQETDPKMKRYYACHCPLVREAILKISGSPQMFVSAAWPCQPLFGRTGPGDQRGNSRERRQGRYRCRFVFIY